MKNTAAGRMACLFLLLLSFYQSFAQTPVTTFADWKNNAKGAYSIVHDDFGSATVSGIENYADTIAYNRGVKFTFGAITGSCDANDWTNARRLVSHGHEVMSHTHNHYCAYDPGWCETSTWGNYATELDQSTDLIHDNTEVYPRFFIWPYDLHTQDSKNYLRDQLHYYGARGGTQNQSINVNQLNPVVIPDFFSINFSVFAPSTSLTELNSLIDLAITEKKWAMREVHGVGDASWGSVPVVNYRNHMDYLKTKMQSGDLWVATASEVTTYKMQTQSFVPVTAYSAANQEITISWNSPAIDLTDLRSDVTLNVNLDGLTGYIYIYQANAQITQYKVANGILSFNAFPHKGTIVIRKTPWNIFPPGPFTVSQGTVCTGQSFTYEVPDQPGNTFEWSYTGTGATINGSGNRVTVVFGTSATSGNLRVRTTGPSGTSPYNTTAITVSAGYQTQGAERCGPGSVTLSVLTAGQYEWYNLPSGGTLLNSTNTFQPTVSKDSLFYTQRKTVVNTYNLGKTALTNTSTTIWWMPSYAQKITLQKAVTINTVKIWASGITNGKVIVISDATKQVVAQSGLINVPSNGTVVTINIPLQAGTYYISMDVTGNHQGAYEGGVNAAYTVANVGTIENKVYGISINAAGVMSITNTYNNSFGPMYDLVLKEFIPDACPRSPILAKVNPVAVQPAAFTQSTLSVCKGSSGIQYTVPVIPNVTYNWSYSGSGFSFTGSGNSISASFSASATAGNLSVNTSNSCGTSTARTIGITMLNPAAQPGSISGTTAICSGASATYSITDVSGATSYVWTLPGGWSGTSTTSSINATAGATGGNITVSAVNGCGTSAASSQSISVNTIPAQPAAFTQSSATVCRGTSATYTVPTVAGVTYNWSYSGSGFSFTGSTNSITASFTAAATSGTLSVTNTNSCGTSVARTIDVTMGSVPVQPATFTQSSANVCTGTSATYTVPTVAGVTYNWSYSGSGFSFTGSTNSINASFTAAATSGTLSVTNTNSCGTSVARTIDVTMNSVPAQPGSISGNPSVCVNTSGTYNIANVNGATSYNWTLPSGWSGTSTTNSVNVTVGMTGGNIMVSATNSCGTSAVSSQNIIVNSIPAQPAAFTQSSASVCRGTSAVYAVPFVSGLTYNWSYSGSGFSFSGSTNSINASFSASATSGTLSVTNTNSCGTSVARTIDVTMNSVPAQPGSISGNPSVCANTSGTYNIANVNGATSYNWTLPSGWSGTSSTNSINVTVGMVGGNIMVSAANSCGTSAVSTQNILVTTIPVIPSSFTQSSANVCQVTSAVYAVPFVSGVTYNWSYSGSGFSFTGSTNSINASFSASATSGNINVSYTNACGTGPQRSLAVTVNNLPLTPANLTGALQPCAGSVQTYSVSNQPGATFNWSYSRSGSISGATNQMQLNYGNTSGAGEITVSATTFCGTSAPVSLSVNVLPLPVKPSIINGSSNICVNEDAAYNVSAALGTNYTWSYTGSNVTLIPSGASATLQPGNTASSGNLQVVAYNSCGTETAVVKAIAVKQPAATPDNFTQGNTVVMQGDQNVVYTVPSESGITYHWTYSGTGVILNTSGNSVSIDFSLNATSGELSVEANSGCSNSSAPRSISIQVNPFVSGVQNSAAIQNVLQSYPNPFSGDATVLLRMNENDRVTLKVYDMSGREVNVLTEGEELTSGDHYYKIENISSGAYVVRVSGAKYNGAILITAR